MPVSFAHRLWVLGEFDTAGRESGPGVALAERAERIEGVDGLATDVRQVDLRINPQLTVLVCHHVMFGDMTGECLAKGRHVF